MSRNAFRTADSRYAKRVGALLAAALLAACAATQPLSNSSTVESLPSTLDRSLNIGRVQLMPQPSEADLQQLARAGTSHVIDLRTEREIGSRSAYFDEAELVAALGMRYLHAAVGGSERDATPATILTEVLDNPEARVLLHCASGARAALVHAAYRMRADGLSPAEALMEVAEFGAWPLQMA